MHRYVGALFSDDFGRLSLLTTTSANGFAKKKLDAASQSLQVTTERSVQKARRSASVSYRAAERGVHAELRAARRLSHFSRRLLTKVRPEKNLKHRPPREKKRLWPYASKALPKYDGPVIDRGGQRGIFARFRYYSRKTARAGVSQRVVAYVFHGAELDDDGNPYFVSNVGDTIDEALCAFDHLEQINWSAQANAKLLMHGIFAVDYRQTPDEMMQCGTRWAEETLGRFDLPYVVTLHAPPPDGDSRNWHLHILWSYRPLVRTSEHEWQVSESLRTDLDNPAAMKVLREMYAAVMTDVSISAGQGQIYTAKSNAARGLPHEPQVHLGAARTNRARKGEYVAENEENHERVMRSKAAIIDERLRHAQEALAERQEGIRAFVSRWARAPKIASLVPDKPPVSAAISMDLPEITIAPSRSHLIVPELEPVSRPAIPPAIDVPVAPIPLVPKPSTVRVDLPEPIPTAAVMGASTNFANLRIRAPRGSEVQPFTEVIPPTPPVNAFAGGQAISHDIRSPVFASTDARPVSAPTTPPVSHLPTVTKIVRRPMIFKTSVDQTSLAAPLAKPSVVFRRMPGAPSPPPIFSSFELVKEDRAIEDKLRAATGRREKDEATKRAAESAKATLQREAAMQLMIAAIERERILLRRADGKLSVDRRTLVRFGVSEAEFATPDVQDQLEPIVTRHYGEIAQVSMYLDGTSEVARQPDGQINLPHAAPREIRRLVDAWRHLPSVQSVLNRLANRTEGAPEAGTSRNEVTTMVIGEAWPAARVNRERAMVGSDGTEPFGAETLPTPGHAVARPGMQGGVPRRLDYRALASGIGRDRTG